MVLPDRPFTNSGERVRNPIAEDAADALLYAFNPTPVAQAASNERSKLSRGDMQMSRTRAYLNALLAILVTTLLVLFISMVLGAGFWLGVSLAGYILK